MIEESQSKIIIEMFEDYLSGMRLKDIVGKLVKAGIKNANGKNFTINSVSRILRNENYKGVVFADDTAYTNIYPSIVKEDLFDEVNNRLKISKRTSAHHKGKVNYLLSGKLFCGKCNGLMTGDSGKGKLGKVYNYYKCFTKKKDNASCDKKSMSKEYFEDKIITASQEFFK